MTSLLMMKEGDHGIHAAHLGAQQPKSKPLEFNEVML